MTGRVAVVTGGGSGIGEAISLRLARDGASVAIFDLNGEAADRVAAEIVQAGGSADGWVVDVTDRETIDTALGEVRERLGAPTILVTSAGFSSTDPFLEITSELWDKLIRINLTGTFHCCQAVLPDMVAAGWGRIVTISSSSTHSGVPTMTHYVSAKSGVNGLTKSLALEFAGKGITVNTIPPGFIDTPMLRGAAEAGHISIERGLQSTPVGRVGKPEDIAAACAFLVSEEAGYITGQIIGVNGGRNT